MAAARLSHAPATMLTQFSSVRRLQIITLLAIVLVWEGVAASGVLYRGVAPSSISIGLALFELVLRPQFWFHLSVTAMEIGAAILIGGGAGLALGVLLGSNRFISRAFQPYLICLSSTPKVVILPILYLVFGIGPASKVAIASFACFVPIALSTATGMLHISPVLLQVGKGFDLTRWQMAQKIYFPALLGPIVTGLRIALGSAVVVCLIAEIKFSRAGLGHMVVDSYNRSRFAEVYALLIVIMIFAVAGNMLLDHIASRRPQHRANGTVRSPSLKRVFAG